MGEGFGQAVNEGAKSVAQTIANPGEALKKAAEGTGKAITGVLSATEAAGEYIGDHAARGDMKGVMHDADKTSHAIEHVLTAGIEHLSKMNAHDLGKVVGHDVLPGAIVAVAAPELAGESIALAASAASKIGTIAKESAAIERVAGAYENAASKISAISEKMAGLNKKMEALQNDVRCTHNLDSEGFENIKPPHTYDHSPVSPAFENTVKECQKFIEPWLAKHLNEGEFEFHAVHRIFDVLGKGFERNPACFIQTAIEDPETGKRIEKGIYIAEKVLHNGRWVDHEPLDVLFNMFHETGHAVNATLKTDLLSNSPEFKAAFDPAWSKLDKSSTIARMLLDLPNLERVKDEAFADMWGHLHAIPHSGNDYSNGLKAVFGPVYDYMKGAITEWKKPI